MQQTAMLTKSRVGKQPVSTTGIELKVNEQLITVKGKLGQLQHVVHPDVAFNITTDAIEFDPKIQTQKAKALTGTTRALVANMVHGVTQGFTVELQLVGVGYRGQVQGRTLTLNLGYSHPVVFDVPEGVTIETPIQTEVVIKGADKQQVGEVAAQIRKKRPPEPYKGKGVRYKGEVIKLKETKKK